MSVRTAARVSIASGAAREYGFAAHPAGVDRPEGGCGEGGEYARVRGDRLRHAFPADQASADELAGVALVDPGTGRADGLAAVAAGDVQHSPVFARRIVNVGEFAGCQVDRVDLAAQPDGMGAGPGGGDLLFPLAEVGPGDGVAGVVGGCSRPRAVFWSGGERLRRGGGYGRSPQRCWAAWRVMPRRVPISAHE